MSAPTWLEVLPAIPLARGVPVLMTNGPLQGRSLLVNSTDHDGHACLSPERNAFAYDEARVALDDPQGFGYALRWYGHQPVMDGGELFRELRDAYYLVPNDADRLALAKALSEVTP